MTRVSLGSLCGIVFGVLSAASMLPLAFPDKRAALAGAFFSRFAIGVAIGASVIPGRTGWLVGLGMGFLISLPDAIITKAYAPILMIGAIGGTIIGVIVQRFGR